MNLSILLTDFIDTKGMLKTYRFIPINQYNRIVVDRLSDICTDVKGNTDKDVGLLRVYNSDKCQLLSTTCKIKDFTDSYGKICFCFEHMFIPVESSKYGSCGIYNFILPVDYRLTELHIVDPFDNNKNLKRKSTLNTMFLWLWKSYSSCTNAVTLGKRKFFFFILTGEACIDEGKNKFIDYREQNIYLDEDIQGFFFDDGIKNHFGKIWKNQYC